MRKFTLDSDYAITHTITVDTVNTATQTETATAWTLQEFACAECGEDLHGDKHHCIEGGIVDGLREVELLCPTCTKKLACPYCGEIGGRPVTTYSREWQGCSEHGGMVTWEDERCTLCARRAA